MESELDRLAPPRLLPLRPFLRRFCCTLPVSISTTVASVAMEEAAAGVASSTAGAIGDRVMPPLSMEDVSSGLSGVDSTDVADPCVGGAMTSDEPRTRTPMEGESAKTGGGGLPKTGSGELVTLRI